MTKQVKQVSRAFVFGDDGEIIGAKVILANGVTVQVLFEQLTPEIKIQAMAHGLKQKLGDGAAGKDLTEAQAEIEAIAEGIVNGDWNRRGGGATGGADLVDAMIRVTGQAREAVEEKLRGADDEQRKALAKHPQIAAAMAAIKAERLAKKADAADTSDDVLAAFMV